MTAIVTLTLLHNTGTCSSPHVLSAVAQSSLEKEFGTVGAEYQNNENCWWKIQAPSGKRVRLRFDSFYLESHSSCRYDSVKIYDGTSASARMLGVYCGSNLPADIVSTGNSLYVKFRSDSSVTKAGFRIRYSVASCDKLKVLTRSVGGFGTVGSPYGNFESCSWKIQASSGQRLRLNFERFDLEYGSRSCPYDKVKIYDGSSANAPLNGMYCGTHLPADIVSRGNTMFVNFTSDHSVTETGFRIHYSVVSCSRLTVLTASQGVFGTAGLSYGNNESCSWKIRVPSGQRMRLHFSKFDLESGSSCTYDRVKIYDGSSASAQLKGSYCGSNTPADVESSGSTMFVSFTSDYSVTQSGFEIRYSLVSRSSSCRRLKVLTGSVGLFGTAGSGHGNNERCAWKIQVPGNKQVRLHFVGFNLELHPSCRYDSVKVYDGRSNRSPLKGTYCGSRMPADITSSGSAMFVSFTSDSSVTKAGFRIRFQKVSCSKLKVLTGLAGSIGTAGYGYENYETCSWKVQVSRNKRVRLRFVKFDLEAHSSCNWDSVKVYDGSSASARLKGTYCGSRRPAEIRSSGNTMFVTFTSDSSVTKSGFRILYDRSESERLC
ncbi:Exoskeleton protein RP43 [Lamellibrachia satsuma]|nr:Exoskeleton protein RP43 [Lamellibrachia satsuma]